MQTGHITPEEMPRTLMQAVRYFADASKIPTSLHQPEPEHIPHLAYSFELRAVETFEVDRAQSNQSGSNSRHLFECAFNAWECLSTLVENGNSAPGDGVSELGLRLIAEQLNDGISAPELYLAFHLAACAVLAELPADARLVLRRFKLPESENLDWARQVNTEIIRAFVLLTRKQDGWTDINHGIAAIEKLRSLQAVHEKSFLQKTEGILQQAQVAATLVGLYHLAQIVTLSGAYLLEGKTAPMQLFIEFDRHRDRALAAFEGADAGVLIHFAKMLWAGCLALCQNSIWTHMRGLGEAAEKFG